MRDLQGILDATYDDAATAFNAISDVADYLAVLEMALGSHEGIGPLSQIATVLEGATAKAKEAAAAARRTSHALRGELRA
jgi:hypothetical protein